MLKYLTSSVLSILMLLPAYAAPKKIEKEFVAATITLEFTSGSTKDKIIEYVSQDPLPPATENETTIQKATIHVLVPHHSQRIYDDPNDLKYEYTINYVAKDGWEEVTEKKSHPLMK